jgi:hypothetical protein
MNNLEPLLEPYRIIDLITELNEAIKLDATSILLVDAKGCTDQDNSDLEVICNRTYPKLSLNPPTSTSKWSVRNTRI